MSLQWAMDVALDFASSRINDKSHLLFKLQRSEKSSLGGIQFTANDVSERHIPPGDLFNEFHIPLPSLSLFKDSPSTGLTTRQSENTSCFVKKFHVCPLLTGSLPYEHGISLQHTAIGRTYELVPVADICKPSLPEHAINLIEQRLRFVERLETCLH